MKNLLFKFIFSLMLVGGTLWGQAHTTAMYIVNETDGSITFYARTYHSVSNSSLYGGVIIGSSTYNFTSATNSLPSGATNLYTCVSNFGTYYQVVNVREACGSSFDITTTRTSAVEAPWNSSCNGTVTFGGSLTVSASSDVSTVYYGYAPMECANLSATASGGSGTYSWYWSSGDYTSSATVCPTSSTTYTVTATDGNCTGTATVDVAVVDVRCGKKMDKVLMCKNPGKSGKMHEICVAASAVPAHLSNGSTLGPCPSSKIANADQTVGMDLKAYPNPFTNDLKIMFKATADEHLKIEAYDVMGKSLGILFEEDIEAGIYYNGNINAINFPVGVVLIRVEGDKTSQVLRTYRQ